MYRSGEVDPIVVRLHAGCDVDRLCGDQKVTSRLVGLFEFLKLESPTHLTHPQTHIGT